MADAHKNFAYSTVITAPTPATTGTTLVVRTGDGNAFPDVPFNATVWPTGVQPLTTNAEIVRVQAIVGDTFYIDRTTTTEAVNQNRSIIVGDQIAATITTKTLTDAEAPLTYWANLQLYTNQSGIQTVFPNASNIGSTGSFYAFPVTVPEGIKFNQILGVHSFSLVSATIAGTPANIHSFLYGLYSLSASKTLDLISSSSFSIGETLSASTSLTWNYPTATATVNTSSANGWAYGSFPAGNLTNAAQISSFVNGLRMIGSQFGNSITLSGGVYWMGMIYIKQTAGSVGTASTYGLSHAGIVGQPMNAINVPGITASLTVSALLHFNSIASVWGGTNASNITQWAGRIPAGFVTSAGTSAGLPATVSLQSLGNTLSNVSILPAVTFVYT